MGGGSKLLCILWPLCVYLGFLRNFFLVYGPPNPWGVPGPNSRYPQLASEDFAVFTLDGLFSGT